jgi:enoyl-CoA hydratase
MDIAQKISSLSRPVVILAKEAVNGSYNTTLDQGVRLERRLFHSTFALADQKEGMGAFAAKRKPAWSHK